MRRCLVILLVLAVWLPGTAGAASDRGTLGEILAGLPAVQGAALPSRDLDDRVVLVAFFASWCQPCRHEFPHLNTMQEAYGDDGLQIVAINVFETHDGLSTPAKLKAFLDLTRPIFPILKGDAETRRVFGNLDRIPTMFLFARDGALSFVFRHERNAEKTHLSEAELREAIEPLL